ncbi:hypothetical protein IQ22_02045 [Pseudomonas duriflava]|uniref:Uncharacterized protein n=1 Tax=Pseudomonas duriflava TaxID=459528 RepID=A0A562QBU6_9PSED|nr:hypothetical protein [Pseudomonas duriflava]TWI54183.1 hypothetical protein IQ22_02045 [Pseudomonas duriflava]
MSSHLYEVNYIHNNDPKATTIESDSDEMPVHQAALKLIEQHQADAENSLAMPSADAAPEEIMQLAESHGIHDIRVTGIPKHKSGTTPGHYQQP